MDGFLACDTSKFFNNKQNFGGWKEIKINIYCHLKTFLLRWIMFCNSNMCVCVCVCVCVYVCVYTGCPRRNVKYFGRVFLMLNYTDITQNTYIQCWTVTEIMAREVWNFDSCYTLIDYQIHIETGRNMWFL